MGLCGRDAVHVAVAPVVAGMMLRPGDHVGLLPDGSFGVGVLECLGVVDPFLPVGCVIGKGVRFWLCLYPGSIESLRHEWTHRGFPLPAPKSSESLGSSLEKQVGGCEESSVPEVPVPVVGPDGRLVEAIRYLEKFAEDAEMDYVKLLEAAESFLECGSYVHVGFSGPDAGDEFWDAFELVSGRVVGSEFRESFFTCSC